jgi:predicted ATPase/class 3 adenylate cyclase
MTQLPSGTVTFLFTDLEVSTRLWDQEPDAMQDALARHDAILRDAIARHDGHVVKGRGDGVHAVFTTADSALRAAVDAQVGIDVEQWTVSEPLRVRIGLHTGVAELRDGDYFGSVVNRAARLMDAGHGGQILVSGATSELLKASGVEFVDLGSHQLRDLGEPERIFQVLHGGMRADFAPLKTLDTFSTNLPLQVTTFVGREDDVADVIEALGQSRVVTLIGVGGVGKTRLAVQTAAQVLPDYRDGAYLCELGPLNDAGQVPDAVATALGVRHRSGQPMTEAIVNWLRSKRTLVVLDNCEHLLDAAAEIVAQVVGSCPGVTVLATGREGLGVRGERMMMVRSLPLPGSEASTEEILATDAVHLFTDRADQAGGAVSVDDETAATIAQLCRRLDGIPLAIELAAARTRMMSPQEIADRLDERFRLLTGGSRTAVERHQTLRRAVEWSYELLDERERTVLDRLGVFAGGFTLDAAEAVVRDDDIDPLDVLDSVAQLVDKSLVDVVREHRDTRYRLLETIRTYALERLDEAAAADDMRRRHATWCADLVGQVSAGARGRDEAMWLDRMDRETDNIRAALTWATGADDADLALSLLGDFSYWNLSGRRLAYWLAPWAASALATTGAADDPRYSTVLAMRAMDHANHQRLADAERDARLAVDLLARPGMPFSPTPWSVVSMTLIYQGRAHEIEGVDTFLEAARATGDDFSVAHALVFIALVWYVRDDLERCLTNAEEAMQIAQRIGNPTLLTNAAFYLGSALTPTDPDRARAVLDIALGFATTMELANTGGAALAAFVRAGGDAMSAQWALQFQRGIDVASESGDTQLVLLFLDTYSQALAMTDHAEVATMVVAAVADLSPHMSNPISVAHRHATSERLRERLGEERFAELTTEGSNLGYEEVVRLALAELNRVIAGADEGSLAAS